MINLSRTASSKRIIKDIPSSALFLYLGINVAVS
jgi:hypothetical protein